mmetsp:Transcript_19080/g.46838  ORF Transcript_19080/g.46838 Transcript_19080/m.46838 type:complete len:104 (-) Transcript_19080:178-489(-)
MMTPRMLKPLGKLLRTIVPNTGDTEEGEEEEVGVEVGGEGEVGMTITTAATIATIEDDEQARIIPTGESRLHPLTNSCNFENIEPNGKCRHRDRRNYAHLAMC